MSDIHYITSFFLRKRRPPRSTRTDTLFPYTTLCRSAGAGYANEIPGIPVEAFNEISDVLSSVYGIETGPLVRSRPFSNDRYFGRLDWQVNDDHRVELTYQRLDEGSTSPDDFSSRSEEHTSELQSLMRISYAVFCLKKKIIHTNN